MAAARPVIVDSGPYIGEFLASLISNPSLQGLTSFGPGFADHVHSWQLAL
jgi:hypothetical protein